MNNLKIGDFFSDDELTGFAEKGFSFQQVQALAQNKYNKQLNLNPVEVPKFTAEQFSEEAKQKRNERLDEEILHPTRAMLKQNAAVGLGSLLKFNRWLVGTANPATWTSRIRYGNKAVDKAFEDIGGDEIKFWDEIAKGYEDAREYGIGLTGADPIPLYADFVGQAANPINFIGANGGAYYSGGKILWKAIGERFLINSLAGGSMAAYEYNNIYKKDTETTLKAAAFGALASGALGEGINGLFRGAIHGYGKVKDMQMYRSLPNIENKLSGIFEANKDDPEKAFKEMDFDIKEFLKKNAHSSKSVEELNKILKKIFGIDKQSTPEQQKALAEAMDDPLFAANEDNPTEAIVNTFLYGESLDTKLTVLNDLENDSPSSVIDQELYDGLKEYNAETIKIKGLDTIGQELAQKRAEIFTAYENSVNAYAKDVELTQTYINKFPDFNIEQINELVYVNNKPTPEMLQISSYINDGVSVHPRAAGMKIISMLESEIKHGQRTPEELAVKLKELGFGDEQINVFVEAYAKKDIMIAKQYIDKKIAAKGADDAVSTIYPDDGQRPNGRVSPFQNPEREVDAAFGGGEGGRSNVGSGELSQSLEGTLSNSESTGVQGSGQSTKSVSDRGGIPNDVEGLGRQLPSGRSGGSDGGVGKLPVVQRKTRDSDGALRRELEEPKPKNAEPLSISKLSVQIFANASEKQKRININGKNVNAYELDIEGTKAYIYSQSNGKRAKSKSVTVVDKNGKELGFNGQGNFLDAIGSAIITLRSDRMNIDMENKKKLRYEAWEKRQAAQSKKETKNEVKPQEPETELETPIDVNVDAAVKDIKVLFGESEAKESLNKNYNLNGKEPIELTKAQRKEINAKVDEIIKKEVKDITHEDREILRQYTGEGGLGGEGYNTLSQHFTPYHIAQNIYNALENAGVKFNNVLEPAAGSGNFVGMRPNLKWTTIDIDEKAFKVLQRLYPEANHYNISFEEFKGKDFDLIISNVPFIEQRGAGSLKARPDIKTLHDYYFASAIDKVKDNGVVAFITARGTMDRVDGTLRAELMSKADIIGAYRLSDNTFSKNAHTDVGADIIFLQKRPEGVKPRETNALDNEAFIKSSKDENGITINDYYKNRPENIMGEAAIIKDRFGKDTYKIMGEAKEIEIDYKPYSIDTPAPSAKSAPLNSKEFTAWAKENSVVYDKPKAKGVQIQNDKVYAAKEEISFDDIEGGVKIYENISASKEGEKILLLDKILHSSQNDKVAGIKLIDTYKKLYKKHPYDDKALRKIFENAVDKEKFYELGSYFDKDFTPAPVFTRETKFKDSGRVEVNSNSPLKDRLLHNENAQGITEVSKNELKEALDNEYALISDDMIQNNILYYGGNIYKKLDEAKKLLEQHKDDEFLSGKLQSQIEKLTEILPHAKSIDDFSVRGDERWLLNDGLEIYDLKTITKNFGDRSTTEYYTPFGQIFNNYINSRALINIKDGESIVSYRRRLRAAKDNVKETLLKIKELIRSDPELQAKIEDKYNRLYNAYVSPDYSRMEYLAKKAFDESLVKLRDNQKKWVLHALYEGKGINAHDVGGGKTFAAIVLARAMKQRGIAKKPLFVVPSKVLKNWEKEIKRAYPDAKVINLYALPKDTRTKTLYELANQEADYILISHEGFKKLQLPLDVEMRYTDELLNENLKTEALKGRQLALEQEKIAKYKAALMAQEEDKKISLDALGIDAIIADEARAFKNIGVNSKLARAGLGKQFSIKTGEGDKIGIDSAIAYDFRFKTRFIAENNNGRNVFMLDATPTPNKPLEIYTMLKHLDNNIFDEYGIRTDMDFSNKFFSYGKKVTADGKREDALQDIISAWDLKSIIDRYIEKIPTSAFESYGIKLPKKIILPPHIIEPSPESTLAFGDILERLGKARGSQDEMGSILGIYSEGRSASTDARLYQRAGIREFVDPTAKNNKLLAVIDEVLKVRKKDKKAGQVIFLDNAGHTAMQANILKDSKKGQVTLEPTLTKNLHQEIKEKLIASGEYKANEIAILNGKEITDPTSGKEVSAAGKRGIELKQKIVDAYDKGQIKVIIGTTQSAGEGMNIQKFTTDIHHVDMTWTSAQIEQRNGRGVRYGNIYDSVNIHNYFQKGSFDELSYKKVREKEGWNEALWEGKIIDDKVSVEEVSNGMPTTEELMIQLESDPVKRQKLELQVEHQRLEDEYNNAQNMNIYLNNKFQNLKGAINVAHNDIKALEEKLKTDTPNQTLKDLRQRILKTKEAAKRAELQSQFDKMLAGSQTHTKNMIEAKQKRINEMSKQAYDMQSEIKTSKEDLDNIAKKLTEFEDKNMNDKGEIVTDFEEIC
ncbi:MAG: hypothetical protein LBF71_00575 [Campylobacteraceae bacterium]|jgi:phospholipid N-methyltransferase|nr:hypothetical protein [Campylobacteraceae bacterium]